MRNILILFISVLVINCSNKKKNQKSISPFEIEINQNPKMTFLASENVNLFDIENNHTRLSDIQKNHKELLILRFTELNCNLCYESSLKIIKEFKHHKNLIVITSFDSSRSFKIVMKNFSKEFKIYNTPSISLKDIGIPYFFKIDKNNIISNEFVHQKIKPQKTIDYLNEMLND